MQKYKKFKGHHPQQQINSLMFEQGNVNIFVARTMLD